MADRRKSSQELAKFAPTLLRSHDRLLNSLAATAGNKQRTTHTVMHRAVPPNYRIRKISLRAPHTLVYSSIDIPLASSGQHDQGSTCWFVLGLCLELTGSLTSMYHRSLAGVGTAGKVAARRHGFCVARTAVAPVHHRSEAALTTTAGSSILRSPASAIPCQQLHPRRQQQHQV